MRLQLVEEKYIYVVLQSKCMLFWMEELLFLCPLAWRMEWRNQFGLKFEYLHILKSSSIPKMGSGLNFKIASIPILAVFGGYLGDIWGKFGGYLGDIWGIVGRCLLDIWVYLGDI